MITNSSLSRVLLIAPQYFGYEQEITSALVLAGYTVDFLPDRPFNNTLMKALIRYRPELGGHLASEYFFSEQIEKLGRSRYSIILVIQGEGVTAATLVKLRKTYPGARLVFYSWDSIENKPYSQRNLHMYDYCMTFDPLDAKKYGLYFRPLFYTDGFDRLEETSHAFDLSFIGTVHSDRYRIVHTVLEQLPPNARTFIYLYLQAPWIYNLRRAFTNTINGSKRKEFRFKTLSRDMVKATFLSSKAVLDIEHIKQRGATIRTMEALGSRSKIVTTNANLRNYDFYNPENIHIINRKAPSLHADFLVSPYEDVPLEVRKKYSIHQWIREVCGVENAKG